MADDAPNWIEDIELADANIKWNFSHFDGRADTFNDEGDHNFTVILPEEEALSLLEEGWNIHRFEGQEEGDLPEYTLKVKISYRFEPPKIYLLKGNRKIRADERDLQDIKRSTCDQIDVIITPSRWVHGKKSGISAYTKELYAKVRQSRFEEMYADYEEI